MSKEFKITCYTCNSPCTFSHDIMKKYYIPEYSCGGSIGENTVLFPVNLINNACFFKQYVVLPLETDFLCLNVLSTICNYLSNNFISDKKQ